MNVTVRGREFGRAGSLAEREGQRCHLAWLPQSPLRQVAGVSAWAGASRGCPCGCLGWRAGARRPPARPGVALAARLVGGWAHAARPARPQSGFISVIPGLCTSQVAALGPGGGKASGAACDSSHSEKVESWILHVALRSWLQARRLSYQNIVHMSPLLLHTPTCLL